jgi:hypothetical protein
VKAHFLANPGIYKFYVKPTKINVLREKL